MPTAASTKTPTLVRELGPWDVALITSGSVLGTGIFLTPSDHQPGGIIGS